MAAHAHRPGDRRDRIRLISATRYANAGPWENQGPAAIFMGYVVSNQSASDETTGSFAGLSTKFVSIRKLLSLV